MSNIASWDWPQYVVMFWLCLRAGIPAILHGTERKVKLDGPWSVMAASVALFVLLMGGFFA